MTVRLDVTVDARDMRRLAALRGKSRMAGAKALTVTAQDAQKKLRGEAAGLFHLRNSWVQQGIRIKPATPGTMAAQVGSIDKYMARHVIGTDKAPDQRLSIRRTRDSRGRIATGGLLIAAYGSIGEIPKHQAVRGKLRRIDGQKKKTFQIRAKNGNVVIVRRSQTKRLPLEVLGQLDNGAEMSPVWRMEVSVRGVVGARFSGHFERALAALAR